ncbi:MAG: bifunctional molybdenum cofactor biosynthesis protein MoaC/MoaB [Nitrososphaeraceae archaeon]
MNDIDSYVGMIDVSNKYDTLRSATAEGIVRVNPETISKIKNGKSPKGNIIEAAKISSALGAKKTSELIPYCHPISIDHISTRVTILESSIVVQVGVKSISKTGVEMESLTGCCTATLCIFDMLKPIDQNIQIESIKVISKTGGKTDFVDHTERTITSAVIVISDSTFNRKRIDKSGKLIVNRIKNLVDSNNIDVDIVDYLILPDDKNKIKSALIELCDNKKIDLIITSGGTGLGKRDITSEVTKMIIDKEAIGISESIRSHGQRRTPFSMFSNGRSGIRGKTLIINLPGNVKGVSESLDLLLPSIFHAFNMIHGKGH